MLTTGDSKGAMMSAEQAVTMSDVGKNVLVAGDDEVVGEIADVEERDDRPNRIYVTPDPDASSAALSRLGWDETGAEHYQLDPEHVEAIYEHQVRISSP